jgi:predicted DNA-binding transcriptional regulator YafY
LIAFSAPKLSMRPPKRSQTGDIGAHLASSWTIVAGSPRRAARLRFSAKRAVGRRRTLASGTERTITTDGSMELALPCSDPTELFGDILSHDAEVEVLVPAEPRDRIRAQIETIGER